MSKMRKLLESLDDIIDGEAIGADEQPVKKPKAKFLGNPHRANDAPVVEDDEEDDEDLTEAMKAQFEDYVKNKAVPDTKKELKLEKQGDGSYQVKNEKGSVVCRGTKTDCQTHITKKNAELNDAKLDEGIGGEDIKAKALGKFAYYAITAKGKQEPGNPYPAGTKANADFDQGYEQAWDEQSRTKLAAKVEYLAMVYNVGDRIQLLKRAKKGVTEGVSLKQKYEDKKRADKDAVRFGRMTQAEFDKKWTRAERPKPVKEAKWRADDLEDVTWTRDLDTGERHPIGDNAGYPGDELTQRPGSYSGPYKRMTKKGALTAVERHNQFALKKGIKYTNKNGGLTGPKGKLPESAPSSKTDKMAKLRSILDKLSDELKNTRKQIGSSKKVTEAPIDQQVPTAAGNTVQAAPGVTQAANQAQQVPANQAQQLPKPAPGQPQQQAVSNNTGAPATAPVTGNATNAVNAQQAQQTAQTNNPNVPAAGKTPAAGPVQALTQVAAAGAANPAGMKQALSQLGTLPGNK